MCFYAETFKDDKKRNKANIVEVQSDQQENKSRVPPHFLFYRNVSLNLIVPICILALPSRFIGCLPIEKYIMY
jgi:hypothetical protein